MTFTINGTDFSSYVGSLGIIETQRKVIGPNAGTSINGNYIEDLLAVKYDVSFVLKPLPADMLALLISACENPTVTLVYDSGVKGTTRTIQATVNAAAIRLLMYFQAQGIYGDSTLTFNEI